jgi:ATP-dependent helicase/DNAse subunit B
MSGRTRTLRVFPDAERVEESLLLAARGSGFVDASAYLTFGQFVELFEGAKQLGRRPCSPLTSRVVLLGAARELGPGPYGDHAREPSFARSALDLVWELKAGGLSADEFAAAAEELAEGQLQRGRYLARLYRAYEAKMAKLQLADREDLLRGAVWRIREAGLPSRIRSASRIELSHLHDFPPTRLQWLIALAQSCDAAGISFSVHLPAAGSIHLDATVDPVLAELERVGQGFRHVDASKQDVEGEGHPFAQLGRFLFAPEAAAASAQELAPRLSLFSAGTARDEARELARRALACVRRGTSPDRIAIVFRDLGQEAEWVAEALEEVGLQARVRRGAPVSSTAAGRIALDLPMVVDERFRSDQLAALLSSRYVPAVSTGCPEAPEGILALAGARDDALGAQADRGAYQVRLEALANRLERKGEAARAARVRSVLQKALELIACGNRIFPSGRALELLDQWWTCLRGLRFPESVRQREQRADEATSLGRAVLRSLARDQAAAEALFRMTAELEGALKLAGAGADRIDRRAFHRLLLDAAGDFNLMEKAPRGAAVHVFDVREIAGRRFDQVFLAGAADGRFPRAGVRRHLLGDEEKGAVNRWARRDVFRLATGDPEGRIAWQLAEDRLLFYLALCSAQEGATISYPREGGDGKEQIASAFVQEIERLAASTVQHLPRRPVPPLDEVESESELRERVALEVLGRPELRTSEPDPARDALSLRFEAEPWMREARALVSVEEERLRFFSNPEVCEGRFTGLVDLQDMQGSLEAMFRFGPERPVSAHQLARFGNCAFQGFLSYPIGLEEPDVPGEELDSKGQGSFWHQLLEGLFRRLKERGLLNAGPDALPPGLLAEALEEAALAAEQSGHVGHPALWKLGQERAQAMVRRLLRAEHRGLPFDGHLPIHTELRFGYSDAPESWREVSIPAFPDQGNVFVRGKIDRLDRLGSGVGVIDYKSGYIANGKRLVQDLLSTDFQLPLYLYAARASGEKGELKAALLSLRTAKSTHLEEAIAQYGNQSLEELLSTDPEVRRRMAAQGGKNLANAIQELLAKLRGGHFPIRAEDCNFCSFQSICRVTERRFYEGEA